MRFGRFRTDFKTDLFSPPWRESLQDAGAHFRLHFSYNFLQIDSDEFQIRSIAVILFPVLFPVIVFPVLFPLSFATNQNFSLSTELQNGIGSVLTGADIVRFNLSIQANDTEAVACCGSALNTLETNLWAFNHTRELPSMVRSQTYAGYLSNITLSTQYVLGDRFTILFHFTDFTTAVVVRSPC